MTYNKNDEIWCVFDLCGFGKIIGRWVLVCDVGVIVIVIVSVDINKFLEEQVKNGSLKSETVSAALKLIDRSRQEIERISPQNDDYVVMHNNGRWLLIVGVCVFVLNCFLVSITEAENDNEDDDHYALVVETTKKCGKLI